MPKTINDIVQELTIESIGSIKIDISKIEGKPTFTESNGKIDAVLQFNSEVSNLANGKVNVMAKYDRSTVMLVGGNAAVTTDNGKTTVRITGLEDLTQALKGHVKMSSPPASSKPKVIKERTLASLTSLPTVKIETALTPGKNFNIESIKQNTSDIVAKDDIKKGGFNFTIHEGAVQAIIELNSEKEVPKKENVTVLVKIDGKEGNYEFTGGTVDANTGSKKKLTITGLRPPKKFYIDLAGTIRIKNNNGNEAADISVRFGNNNPAGDWIVETMDNASTKKKSSISLNAILEWSKSELTPERKEPFDANIKAPNAGNSNMGGGKVEINKIALNITQGTFIFDVAQEPNSTIDITDNVKLQNIRLLAAYVYDPMAMAAYADSE